MDILRTSGNAQLVELWWLKYGHFPYFRANSPTLEKTVLKDAPKKPHLVFLRPGASPDFC
jgi:hypothetical protein